MPKEKLGVIYYSHVMIDEAIKELEHLHNQVLPDTELVHMAADKVLTDLLGKLMFQEVVEAYGKINKWYA